MKLVAASYAPDTVERGEGWRAYALCAQTDPELFHPSERASTAPAKRICMSCEVRRECLEWALATGQTRGVWGGMSANQRTAILNAREPRTTTEAR